MPPVTISNPRTPAQKAFNARQRRKYRERNSRKKINPSGRGKRSNGNTIALSTLSNKSENLSINFREHLEFTHMGGDAGSTPTLIRINLNNPVSGGVTPAPNQSTVVVLSSLKAGATNASAIHHSYNDEKNLSGRLDEYFTQYRRCIVTSSEATVVITPLLNQTAGMTDGYRSVVPFFSNRQSEDPAAAGQNTYLFRHNPNAMSEVEAWCIRQQDQTQLIDPVDGTPPLETLKQGIPGMRMTRINVTPNSKKGVTFKMKYTPKSQYDFKDWKDNQQLLEVFRSAVGNALQKEAYMYVGIAGRYKGNDPKAAPTEVGLPLFNVEVRVKYNLNFSQRFNKNGNNEPSPHDEL